MADTKKKKTSSGSKAKSTSTKRATSSTRKPATRKAPAKKTTRNIAEYHPLDDGIHQEIIGLLIILLCLFVFFCLIGIVGGAVGPAINDFMRGLFGTFAFVLPVVGVGFTITNYWQENILKNRLHPVKKACVFILVFFVGVIACFIANMGIADIADDKDFLRELYESKVGGGAVFGLFACLLFRGLGSVGTVVISIIICLICLVAITERSFIKLLKNSKDAISDYASQVKDYEEDEEEYERRQAIKQARLEEKRKRREEQLLERQLLEEEREAEEARRREAARKARAEKEQALAKERDQLDDERIVSANRPDQNRVLKTVGKNFGGADSSDKSDSISKDEMHEIQVDGSYFEDPFPADDFKPKQRNTNMEEIFISEEDRRDDSPIPVPFVDVSEGIHISSGTSVLEEKVISSGMPQAEEVIAPLPLEHKEPKVYEVIEEVTKEVEEPIVSETITTSEPAVDLYNMPEPVTKETHEKAAASEVVEEQKKEAPKKTPFKYKTPPLSLLNENKAKHGGDSSQTLKETAFKLQETLKTFGVPVTVSDISQGPSVTRYELTLGEGVKVNKIVSLTDDIKLQLAAQDVRIEAPIPGKAAVGIELPNKEASAVFIRDLIDNNEFKKAKNQSPISFGVGEDISGKVIVGDIAKMPHMLIAGSTGSGKSVCINTLIMSILYNAHPDDVKLIMIDPKVVELSVYNGIPHLLVPVVTDPKKANAALQWAVREMEKRYKAFADLGCRDLKGFNEKLLSGDEKARNVAVSYDYDPEKKVPLIVVIVDELADLMMTAAKDVEESICRLAQLARAAGIHLVIATQRPSVDVITGLIKANMPSRIAFRVSSGVDSRTILDMVGAERLLGKGDMLYYPQGYSKPLRVQGAFVSDDEVLSVVDYLKNLVGENKVYDESIVNSMETGGNGSSNGAGNDSGSSDYDEYLKQAALLVAESGKASAGSLQRTYRIGFNRAARMLDQLEEVGVVGPENGTKPREVLLSPSQVESLFEELAL